jgi:hypothetical protein
VSRNVSDPFRQAVFAQETGEAILVLMEIDHPDLAEPIRVTHNDIDVVSNGSTYIAFPFQIELPTDSDNKAPTARLTIDNVDRRITETVRQIQSPPTVDMRVVRGSDPDTIETEFPQFQLRNITYDAQTISGELNVEQFAAEPYPAGRFTPAEFPGLFS